MDGILTVHRNDFVFRDVSAKELEEHKQVIKLSLRTGNIINALISDPDFKEPDLVARLQLRIRQLQDAYDTFHDRTLSNEDSEKILREVFPGRINSLRI